MKRILMTIICTSLILSACNLEFISVSETNTPAPTIAPTITSAPSATPTETVLPASPTPELAPMCTVSSASSAQAAQCQLPTATDSSAFCAEKDSYNLILVSKGSTFQALTKGFTCRDAGLKNDQQMVTCTGQMAADYQVEVCNPSCVVPTVQAAVTQCADGYNYDTYHGCCTQELVNIPKSCVVLELKSTTCVVNCKEYNRKKVCEKNSVACYWADDEGVCKLRK